MESYTTKDLMHDMQTLEIIKEKQKKHMQLLKESMTIDNPSVYVAFVKQAVHRDSTQSNNTILYKGQMIRETYDDILPHIQYIVVNNKGLYKVTHTRKVHDRLKALINNTWKSVQPPEFEFNVQPIQAFPNTHVNYEIAIVYQQCNQKYQNLLDLKLTPVNYNPDQGIVECKIIK
jgi:hypothetical protein